MWTVAVGHVCPARLLQLEAAVGLVFPLVSVLEILRVVQFHRVPREARVALPGFLNHPACPSPYATILGPIPKAPVKCQV